jgi:restriction system protein
MNKESRLKELAVKRQQARWPTYKNIGDYYNGAYECDFVSPYTKTAGNLATSVMLMLQDWCSDKYLSQELSEDLVKYGHSLELPTNKNLKKLLRKHLNLSFEDVYATNLFPFIKIGAMNANIPAKDLVRAAHEFALPQIDIVGPKVVICFGKDAFNALRKACDLKVVKNLAEGIRSPFWYGKAQIWCQSHPGQLGKINRNRGGQDQVAQDWNAMTEQIDS